MSAPLDVPLADLRTRRSMKWREFPPDVLPLPVAEMDVTLAEPLAAVLRRAIDRSDTGYNGDHGELGASFAGFARRRWGWEVDPAQVALCADIAAGATETLRRLVRPGDGVLITPPVYPPFYEWIDEVGAHPVEVPVLGARDDWRLDLDGIERQLAAGTRVVLLCSPHNPTGRVHEPDELRRIAELAEHHGATVLADEVHGPLTLPGAAFHPFLSVSASAARTGIALTSPSKAWNIPGLKAALIVTATPEQRAVATSLPYQLSWGAGLFGVLAAIAAYDDGEPWLDTLVAALRANAARLAELLAAELPDVAYTPPRASFLAWLDCRRLGIDEDPSAVFLERGRVALLSGRDFGQGGEGFARLNLGTSPELLEQAVGRMRAALRR